MLSSTRHRSAAGTAASPEKTNRPSRLRPLNRSKAAGTESGPGACGSWAQGRSTDAKTTTTTRTLRAIMTRLRAEELGIQNVRAVRMEDALGRVNPAQAGRIWPSCAGLNLGGIRR